MSEPYAICSACEHQFMEPDIDEHGNRLMCPACGEFARTYFVRTFSGIHLTGSATTD